MPQPPDRRARSRRGLGAARRGAVFPLNLPLDQPDPPLGGRSRMVHEVLWVGGTLGHDDQLSEWNTQSSSQWDGFRHIRHPAHGFYNGVADEAHGVHHWAARGIVGRGVLADVGRHRVAEGRPLDMLASDPIDPEELSGTLERQGTTVTPGDILLVRTGWIEWYREPTRSRVQPWLIAIAPRRFAPVRTWHGSCGSSNSPRWPPTTPRSRRGHRREPHQRSASAPEGWIRWPSWRGRCTSRCCRCSACRSGSCGTWPLWRMTAPPTAVTNFLLTSSPLHLVGGVGSPPNALAIK